MLNDLVENIVAYYKFHKLSVASPHNKQDCLFPLKFELAKMVHDASLIFEK